MTLVGGQREPLDRVLWVIVSLRSWRYCVGACEIKVLGAEPSFSENDVTSYQILEVSSSCSRERAKPSPIKLTALIFHVKNIVVQ